MQYHNVGSEIMCSKIVILIFALIILNSYALNCRSDGSLKSEELKRIYNDCLKQQEKNSNNSNRSSEQNWRDRDSGQGYSNHDWSEYDGDRRGGKNKRGEDRGRNWMDGKMDFSYNNRGQTDWRDQNDEGRNNYNQFGQTYDRNENRYDRNNGMNRNNGNSHTNDRSDEQDSYYQNSDYGNRNMYSNQNRRFKREKNSEKNSGQRSQYNPNVQRSDDNYRGNRNSSENTKKNGKACAMHCFLDNLHMTGDNGMPDRYLVTNAMTKDVRNEDLRDFLQESIEECFQILDNENTEDKCEFSKNLLTCLSEKGRSNCDDWKDDIQFI